MPHTIKAFAILTAVLFSGSLYAADMAKIEGGSYRPLYLKKDTPLIPVKSYQLDKTAVTNAEYHQFVQKHPQWQRGQVQARHAEPTKYLKHWVKKGQSYVPAANTETHPVTNVSWFAAYAYCKAQGKRLPTIDEWEYAGQASQFKKNGTDEEAYNRTILDWYADSSRQTMRPVGKDKPNYWGVHDMHGLIWEWTQDFNSSLLSAGSANSSLFCGGGTANSTDPNNYAAFMRYGIRTSLQAPYVLHNLGFRCAK